MHKKRPERVKTAPRQRHVDGHTLKAIAGRTGLPGAVRRTAEIEDYEAAHPRAIAFNEELLADGEISGYLKDSGGWIDDQGVAFVQLEGELDSKQVTIEIDERFQDGELSFAAKDQIAEYQKVKGGWAKDYKNVLDFDPREQQKSIVAIKSNWFSQFKCNFPYTHDVVQAVQAAIAKMMPEFGGKLVPHEYTFFFGTSRASCTKWHSDQAEHKGVVLKLTTLTLLSSGETSMNVAPGRETWLKTPFSTVMFDPHLFHRSGATSFQVIKLSIHWKALRSEAPVKVKEEAGPSGVTKLQNELETLQNAAEDEDFVDEQSKKKPKTNKGVKNEDLEGQSASSATSSPWKEDVPAPEGANSS